MIKRVLAISFLVFIAIESLGQFEAGYTQYMFNGLAINPAYAGSHQSLSMSVISRFQSPGFEGAPNTQTFSAHSGIKGKKIGLGLMVITDKIGVIRQTGFYGSFAYKVKFKNSTLSMGLQGGATSVDSDYSQLLIKQPGDPLATGDVKVLQPNIGAGIYYHSKRFYVGASMPQMLDAVNNEIYLMRPIIVTSGVVFKINEALDLKPNILFRVIDQNLVEFHYNMNLLIHEILWVGASYRPGSSISGLLELQLTDQLRLGYAYDATISEINVAEAGSHEIMLNYQLRFTKKKVEHPRYF
ncbi:MAG: type IX secretion system membrane protein PorP/SprF [Bacteroidota bacterium]